MTLSNEIREFLIELVNCRIFEIKNETKLYPIEKEKMVLSYLRVIKALESEFKAQEVYQGIKEKRIREETQRTKNPVLNTE